MERLSPVALLTGNGVFEPLVFHIVIALIAGVLRLHDDTVTPTGVGGIQAPFLGVVSFNEVDATATHIRVYLEHPVDDVPHLIGVLETLLDDRGGVGAGYVDV